MTEATPQAGDSITASRDDILRAAADDRTEPEVGERATSAVGRHLWPEEELEGGLVERENLIGLYTRRLKRSAQLRNPPVGMSDLVQRLTDRVDAEQVRLFVAARNGAVISLFSDPEVGWLLGCVVSESAPVTDGDPGPEGTGLAAEPVAEPATEAAVEPAGVASG